MTDLAQQARIVVAALAPAFLLLSSCNQSGAAPDGARIQAVTKPIPLRSSVDGLSIVAASHLPSNSQRGMVDDYCEDYAVAHPVSPGGQAAARAGWIVTSERKLGRYDAVTLVGKLDPATSATCVHEHGNIAVFDRARLLAIAYWRDPSAEPDSIGSAEQLDEKRIRLNSGMPGPPIADIVLRQGIRVEPVASEDRLCGGSVVVPNVFGQPIQLARTSLIANGWMPSSSIAERNGGQDDDLARNGVPEVQSCAGTGYGFCAFTYRHRNGAALRVISMGEEQSVVIGSTVGCRSVKP